MKAPTDSNLLSAIKSLTTNVNRIGKKIDSLEFRLASLERRFDTFEAKVTLLETTDIVTQGILYEQSKRLEVLEERSVLIPKLYDNVDKLIGEILENRQERVFMTGAIKNHEVRITTLEKK